MWKACTTATVIAATLALSGCESFYVSPGPETPTARLHLYSYDMLATHKGTQATYSPLKPDSTGVVRIPAGERFTVQGGGMTIGDQRYCRVAVSFVPEPEGSYRPLFKVHAGACTLTIVDNRAAGATPETMRSERPCCS